VGQKSEELVLALDFDVLATVIAVLSIELKIPRKAREGGREGVRE